MYLTYYLIMSDEEKAKDLINDKNNIRKQANFISRYKEYNLS